MKIGTLTRATLSSATIAALSATALIAPTAMAADHDDHHDHIAAAYTLELLAPAATDTSATALGINDTGDVVGLIRPGTAAQPQFTAIWERHGDHFHRHQLNNLEGSQFSRGFGIAADGTVAGEAFDSSGNTIPIRWSADGTPNHVTNLNESGSGILNDISEGGTAVGTASGTGVTLSSTGVVTALPTPTPTVTGATVSSYSATSISGDTIGGRAVVSEPHGDHSHDYSHPVVWRAGTVALLPRAAGASNTTVSGVAASGIVVGSSTISGSETALIWDTAGEVSSLPHPGLTDFPHTAAKAINNSQLAVGYASKFAGNTSFGGAALIWDAHSVADLNALVPDLPETVTLQSASDINEAGQIVGTATTSDGQRGFVLTPVSHEPVDTTLTIAGIADHYHPGDVVTLTAQQDPQTDLDHYHWFTRPNASTDWSLAPEPGISGTFTFTAQLEQDGYEVLVRLYDDNHSVVAESAPVTLHVTNHGGPDGPGPGDPAVPPATIAASDTSSRFGKRATISVRVSAAGRAATGTVRVSGTAIKPVNSTLVNGVATVRLPKKLAVGRHKVTVSYLGSASAKPASRTVAVRVDKARTKIKASVKPKQVRAGRKRPQVKIHVQTPGISLKAKGKVRIQVNGKKARTVKLVQGKATVRLPRVTKARTLRVRADYVGTKNLTQAKSKIIKMKVRR
ncbi:probable extracellular repeat, HAF family [Micrococcales bacterium KH10]|nr:probable extracellular repeat, HAF family [Micrococcales bacterium KH10]